MITLLCGLAFAGKSTLAAAIAEHQGAVVVSLDAINARRGLRGGSGIAPEEWVRTHGQALREGDAALAAGRAVVVDDTHCTRSLRDAWREVAARRGVVAVLVVVDTPEALALERLRRNQSTGARLAVEEAVFADLVARFEWPGPDEPALRFPAGADPRAWAAAHPPGGPRGAAVRLPADPRD